MIPLDIIAIVITSLQRSATFNERMNEMATKKHSHSLLVFAIFFTFFASFFLSSFVVAAADDD